MQDREADKAAFFKRLAGLLNEASLTVAMALGYRAGLFEAMDRLGGPATSSVIADEAGLSERYVREWLGVMASGGVVELAGGEPEQFRLPKGHADLLTERAGPENMGVYMQEIPLLTASVYDDVAERFRSGEGIGYDRYPRFHRFMDQLAVAKHRQTLVDVFVPSVEQGAMSERLKSGVRVLDVGCSEGTALRLLARAFPRSEFLGVDISEESVRGAESKVHDEGLSNIRFELRDVTRMTKHLDGAFDWITAFDAIHDQARPAQALSAIRSLLASDGVFSMVDIAAESTIRENMDHPMGAFLYTVSLMHCMPVGLTDGGVGLGMMWGRQQAEAMLAEAGFSDVRTTPIPDDPFNLHYCCRM